MDLAIAIWQTSVHAASYPASPHPHPCIRVMVSCIVVSMSSRSASTVDVLLEPAHAESDRIASCIQVLLGGVDAGRFLLHASCSGLSLA